MKKLKSQDLGLSLIAGILIGAMTFGLTYILLPKTDKPVQETGIVVGVAEEYGIELAAEAISATSQTLTATVQTDGGYVYNDDLDWILSFKNATSAWAQGKTVGDYVQMSVSSDTHSVTLTSKAPFGEPIIVTAIAQENVEATASCQLDYVKRVTSISNFRSYDTEGDTQLVPLDGEVQFDADVTYTVGTLAPTLAFRNLKLSYGTGSEWEQTFREAGVELNVPQGYELTTTGDVADMRWEIIVNEDDGSISGGFFTDIEAMFEYTATGQTPQQLGQEDADNLRAYFKTNAVNHSVQIEFEVGFTYNGVSYQEYMTVCSDGNFRFYGADVAYESAISAVVFNKSSLIF